MIKHEIPTKMRVLPSFFSVAASKRIALGVYPIMLEGEQHTSRASTIVEGNVNLYDEKPVHHLKSEGVLTHLPRTNFNYVTDDSWYSPCLAFKSSATAASTLIGSHTVPRGGELLFRLPWAKPPSPSGPRVAGQHFIRFSGFVISFGSILLPSSSVTHIWYNEDFTRCTRLNVKIPFEDSEAHVQACMTSPFPEGKKPNPSPNRSQAGQTFTTDKPTLPPWFRFTKQASGPPAYIFPGDPDYSLTLGKMIEDAVDSLDAFTSNGNAYISEAIRWKELLPPVRDIKRLKKLDPKAWANVYLWFRFGISLSYRDTCALIKAIPKLLKSSNQYKDKKTRLRSRRTHTIVENDRTWKLTYGVRILCDTYPQNLKKFGSMMDKLYSLDVAPTLGNIWDMIPMTFVVDWFIPVSEVLEGLDLRGRLQSFNIYAVTISRKWTSERKPRNYIPGYISHGRIVDVRYIRTVQSTLPLRGVLDTSPRGKIPTRRYIDGVSLFIQRM